MGVTDSLGFATGTAPRSVRRFFERVATRPVWAAFAVMVVGAPAVTALDITAPAWVRYAPLLASVLVLGLPHGAIDHLTPARTARLPVARSAALVGGLYLLAGGAYGLLWFHAPVAAAVLFVVLTWFHWGQGDVYALVALFDADHLGPRPVRVLVGVVRGGAPMVLPLVAFPGRYEAVVSAWVGLFAAEFESAWLFTARTRLAVAVGFGLLTAGALWAGYRAARPAGSRATWRVDAGETLLLWVYFLAVPPVVAVGVYFCLWHSLRHLLRLAAVDDRAVAALDRGDAVTAVVRVARDAAPLTALSVLLLAGLAVLVPATPAGVRDLAALYLVLVAVLTLPHVLVVTWMDRVQSVW